MCEHWENVETSDRIVYWEKHTGQSKGVSRGSSCSSSSDPESDSVKQDPEEEDDEEEDEEQQVWPEQECTAKGAGESSEEDSRPSVSSDFSLSSLSFFSISSAASLSSEPADSERAGEEEKRFWRKWRRSVR